MGLHRKAYINHTKCAEHISVEVPNSWAWLPYLLDSLKTITPEVLAGLAAICQDDADKRINFENVFTYLAPTCFVGTMRAVVGGSMVGGELIKSLKKI
jgi:hypothetical protein